MQVFQRRDIAVLHRIICLSDDLPYGCPRDPNWTSYLNEKQRCEADLIALRNLFHWAESLSISGEFYRRNETKYGAVCDIFNNIGKLIESFAYVRIYLTMNYKHSIYPFLVNFHNELYGLSYSSDTFSQMRDSFGKTVQDLNHMSISLETDMYAWTSLKQSGQILQHYAEASTVHRLAFLKPTAPLNVIRAGELFNETQNTQAAPNVAIARDLKASRDDRTGGGNHVRRKYKAHRDIQIRRETSVRKENPRKNYQVRRHMQAYAKTLPIATPGQKQEKD